MQISDIPPWNRYYTQLLSIIRDLGALKVVFFILIIGHFIIGAMVNPLVTSDFERNLFYGRAFWQYGFAVYDKTPLDIDPNYRIGDPSSGLLSYPNTTFDYPSLQLLFWAVLAPLPVAPILAKWVLSVIDITNFFLLILLFRREKLSYQGNKNLETSEVLFSLSYLLFSIPFSAIEGQSTALTVFFLLLPIFLRPYNKILSYLSIGIGFNWKYVSVLLLPYFAFLDRHRVKLLVTGVLTMSMTILAFSFPLLVSNYILTYFGHFGNLGEYSGQLASNPLLILHPSVSSLLSTGVLILAFFYWFGVLSTSASTTKRSESVLTRFYWSPFVILLGFLKIYATAFPWYWMWFYPCLSVIPLKERRLFTILLGITLFIGIFDFIGMTIGY
ncbi:MAG: hypothetical protein ACFFFG_00115 [Candidatus Thorarchaeota archaeon]